MTTNVDAARESIVQTIISAPNSQFASVVKSTGLVAFGVLFLVIGAHLRIPAQPVPYVLTDVVVLTLAALYGARLGTVTVATYYVLGLLGFSVFSGTPANGIGLVYAAGPTGGYLIGFFIAAAYVGYAVTASKSLSIFNIAFNLVIGQVIILALGTTWLAHITETSFAQAMTVGAAPFVVSSVVKIAVAAFVIKAIYSRARS